MMEIQIYQISKDRDTDNLAFCALNEIEKVTHSKDIRSDIYDKVYAAGVECQDLEQIFAMFNTYRPADFKGHSLSVSDVVEVIKGGKEEPGFYFCDAWGWAKVSFDPEQAQISPNFQKAEEPERISVLLVQPGKSPRLVEIEPDYLAMQKLVGGEMQSMHPYSDGTVLVCNVEGKALGLPFNRAIFSEPVETTLTYREMTALFRQRENEGGKPLTGYIVFSQDSFDREYSELSRTYAISSNNKAFQPGMGGYSIFGRCMDGVSDPCLRLEGYMADEKGGQNGWRIERCYMTEDAHEMVDIIAGSFFITYTPPNSDRFESLPPDLVQKYSKRFQFPERFVNEDGKLQAIPYRPDKEEVR